MNSEEWQPDEANYLGRIGLVHDWLPEIAGAERVLSSFCDAFPESDIFTLFDFLSEEDKHDLFPSSQVHASSLNNIPFVNKFYRTLMPLCMREIEKFDLSNYDAVLSSTVSFAKGVLTSPGQAHICYMHSPPRYAWDMSFEYLRESGNDRGIRALIAHELLHKFRMWDLRTIPSIDRILCNSNFVRKRIKKFYRRDAHVIHPPIDLDFFTQKIDKDDYFVTASRFVPYKKIKLIVEAFGHMPDKRLIVIGGGPEEKRIKNGASRNIVFVGHLPRTELRKYLQNARAFVFAALEDFGIVPLEAQACGTPVIAFDAGGTAETIRNLSLGDEASGVLFASQSIEAIVGAIDTFEAKSDLIHPDSCRRNAERFAPGRFIQSIQDHVGQAVADVRES